MKTVIAMLAMVLSASAFAYEVPQDAVIKVFDSKGREIGHMSRKDYKVVKIEEHPAQVPVAEVARMHYEAGRHDEQEARKSKIVYSAIVTGGVGNDGLKVESQGNLHTVTERQTAVGQATLCGTKNRVGLCATASTNSFYGLGVKLDLN